MSATAIDILARVSDEDVFDWSPAVPSSSSVQGVIGGPCGGPSPPTFLLATQPPRLRLRLHVLPADSSKFETPRKRATRNSKTKGNYSHAISDSATHARVSQLDGSSLGVLGYIPS